MEGGSVPLLLWIVLFETPTPYFFRMRKYIFSYECVRLFTLFHTLCVYECIFARCLLPRKRSCDVPIWVGKKDGAPLLYVKLSFPRLADGFNFNFEECFYPHVSQDLKKNKVMKDFDMRVQSDKFRMLVVWHFCFCCMLRAGFWGNKLRLSELMEPYFASC